MNLYLVTVGDKMPAWVMEAYQDYSKRLSGEIKLHLIEISAEVRGKNADIARIKEREGERILKAIPPQVEQVVALEVNGQSWTSKELSQQMESWLSQNKHTAFLVGGPDGLSEACRKRANLQWSLSALTLPHPLIRVMLAEQFFRAYSILKNHPYHR